MPLIRNNEGINPEFRDPEKLLSRVQHFWSGHGRVAEDMIAPNERGLHLKRTFFEIDEDQNLDITSHAELPYEGAVSSLHRNSLTTGAFPEGGMHSSDRSNLYAASLALSPLTLSRFSHSMAANLDPKSVHTSVYHPYLPGLPGNRHYIETNSNPTEANKEFNQKVGDVLKGTREQITRQFQRPNSHFGNALSASMVPELVKTHVFPERVTKHSRNNPNYVSPRYLGVTVIKQLPSGVRNWTVDTIDLETGSWAKISPDQFFPDYD